MQQAKETGWVTAFRRRKIAYKQRLQEQTKQTKRVVNKTSAHF